LVIHQGPGQSQADVDALAALQRLALNLPDNATALASAAATLVAGAGPLAIGQVLIGLGVLGFLVAARARSPRECFLPLYLLMLCLWPWPQLGARFLVPVLPLVYFYLWRLGVACWQRLAGTAVGRLPAIVALLVGVGMQCPATLSVIATRRRLPDHPGRRVLERAVEWVQQNVNAGQRILAAEAPWLHLRTDHPTRAVPAVAGVAASQQILACDYVLVTAPPVNRQLVAAMALTPERFRERFTVTDDGVTVWLYEVLE
jgi:hypothetical protein